MTKKFIDEVNEDIKEEKIFTFWKKFKYYVIGLIVSIIGGTAGIVGYDSYKINKINNEAKIFEKYIATGQSELLNELVKNGQDGTKFLAIIEQAKKMAVADPIGASKKLYDYSQDAELPEKEYLILASVWIAYEKIQVTELMMRLEKIKTNEFKSLAKFTMVEVLLHNKQNQKAISILNDIINDISVNQYDRDMAMNILSVVKK